MDDELLTAFHNLRLTGRMPHDGVFLDDLVSSGFLEIGDTISAKLAGATFQGTLAAGSRLKGAVLRFEDPSKKLLIEEKNPGRFLRALGSAHGLPESSWKGRSWSWVFAREKSLRDWKTKFHNDVLLENRYWKLVRKIPGVHGIEFRPNQKGTAYICLDAKEETEASLKQKHPLLDHPRVKLEIGPPPVSVLECFREIRRDDGIQIEGTLGAVCFSHDSRQVFGLTARHVIEGLQSFKLYFEDAVDIEGPQTIICDRGDAVLFSLQADIISRSPFFDALDFTALSREAVESAVDDEALDDDSDRESLRSRVSDYERDEDRTDPTNLQWKHLEAVISNRPIFKFGALSGLTVGTYVTIRSQEDGIRKIAVKPAADFETFTEPGDSGSIYYIEYSGSLVPIALHFERSNNRSWGYYLPDLFHQFRHQEQEIRFLDRAAFLELVKKLD